MNTKEKIGLFIVTVLVILMALEPRWNPNTDLYVSSGICTSVGTTQFMVEDLGDHKTYIITDDLQMLNLPQKGDTVLYTR